MVNTEIQKFVDALEGVELSADFVAWLDELAELVDINALIAKTAA